MTKTLISSFFLLLLSISIHAQESEKVSNIRKLLGLTGSGKLGVQVMENMLASYKSNLPNVDSTVWIEIRKDIKAEDLVNLIVPIYDRNFTDEEVRQLIEFYSSPVGKKILQKMPSIVQESMEAGRTWGKALGEKVVDRLKQKGYTL